MFGLIKGTRRAVKTTLAKRNARPGTKKNIIRLKTKKQANQNMFSIDLESFLLRTHAIGQQQTNMQNRIQPNPRTITIPIT